ncbi:MAG: aldo/keto reductase [Cyclobacteriaceae bacterium]|nr:aldo/keto reductase [Cyclobacteriaceae bacterium]
MEYRILGKTGFRISGISLGTWQVGGKWGSPFDHGNADKILNTAIDHGINFIDTADVYGDRESEKAVGRLIKSRTETIYVATKCGRFITPHINQNYTPQVLRDYVEQSLKNMGLDRIDLIQLHCPPTEVYYRPEIFGEFEKLIAEGKVHKVGVSVEKVEEAIKAIEYDHVDSVQIIFNVFRQRPADLFFRLAREKNVGIIARVPLASGLLSGHFTPATTFEKEDHRFFNRNGEQFDKGETFSGIDFGLGLDAVEQLRLHFPDRSLPALALRWILMFDEVSTVIPGASRPEQVTSNVAASHLAALSPDDMARIRSIYDKWIKPQVHHLW